MHCFDLQASQSIAKWWNSNKTSLGWNFSVGWQLRSWDVMVAENSLPGRQLYLQERQYRMG